MKINPIEVVETKSHTILQSIVEYSGTNKKLWYSVEKKYGHFLTTEKLDGFLVAVLLLAMKLGEDITIKGAVSEKLYYNLTNYYTNIMQLVIPSLSPVKIIPDSLDDSKHNCEGGVGTGFSGGIDSFFTILYYLADDIPPHYKITHLIFCNVGSHNPDVFDPIIARELFNSRYELLRCVPKDLGIDYIKVDSNVNEIMRMSILRTYQPRTLSCALILQKLFAKYYYSSGVRYQSSFVGEMHDIAYADCYTVHLLSTETLESISTGAQFSRIEKTKRVALSGIADHSLNVCNRNESAKNCSVCSKCCRTLLALELLGIIDRFSDVFDLNKWKAVRNKYIVSHVLKKGSDIFAEEIREYAESIGYKFSAGQRVTSKILSIMPKPIYDLTAKCYRMR